MARRVVRALSVASVAAAISGFLLVLQGLVLLSDVTSRASHIGFPPGCRGYRCAVTGLPGLGAEYTRAVQFEVSGEVLLVAGVALLLMAIALEFGRRRARDARG
ncbi:MAG: hypothetical protein L3K00_04925 [Thermoplasmata archaeon]|nr:hypothetical protein [Thermoplasmata archaeon]